MGLALTQEKFLLLEEEFGAITITRSHAWPTDEDEPMPTKPGLTRLEHEELGKTLKQLRDEVLHISRQLDTAYAKQSAWARLSYRAAQTLDRLRRVLDRQAFLDYCQWEAHEKAQFKGSQTYFPRADTDNLL